MAVRGWRFQKEEEASRMGNLLSCQFFLLPPDHPLHLALLSRRVNIAKHSCCSSRKASCRMHAHTHTHSIQEWIWDRVHRVVPTPTQSGQPNAPQIWPWDKIRGVVHSPTFCTARSLSSLTQIQFREGVVSGFLAGLGRA